jgi:hypothetical protein
MALSDQHGIVLAVNSAYCELYGYMKYSFFGTSFLRRRKQAKERCGLKGVMPKYRARPYLNICHQRESTVRHCVLAGKCEALLSSHVKFRSLYLTKPLLLCHEHERYQSVLIRVAEHFAERGHGTFKAIQVFCPRFSQKVTSRHIERAAPLNDIGVLHATTLPITTSTCDSPVVPRPGDFRRASKADADAASLPTTCDVGFSCGAESRSYLSLE